MTLLDGAQTQAGLASPVCAPSSGVASSSVGAEGQTGSAARLIASLEAEAYGTWQQAFAEVYGR